MSDLTPGKRVRQKVEVIEGDVTDIRWDSSSKGFLVLVHYTQGGEAHSRWFSTNDVEEVPAAELASAAVAKAAAKPVAPPAPTTK